ncbi:ABC transporter permease [Mesorhizobium sp.]|uniref:ABC transporter permease n=1 Tax=Mesorhizobium sp. TaxID=1871066 RepID=UPI00257A9EB3|nr:ABC transporter permease [Mesorhizobium sp.]
MTSTGSAFGLNALEGLQSIWKRWSARLVCLFLLLPGLFFIGTLLAVPAFQIIDTSLRSTSDADAYGLQNYVALLSDEYYFAIVIRTLAIAVVTTLICAVLGYPVGYFLARNRSRYRFVVFIAVVSPLLVSAIIRTIGWTIILGNEGLLNTSLMLLGLITDPLQFLGNFWSVVLGLVHLLLPFMILPIAVAIGQIDDNVIEASYVMGATPQAAFIKVVLPLSARGISAGAVIVFCLSIGAYVTPQWLSLGKLNLMTRVIYDAMLVYVDWPQASAVAILLGCIIFAVVGLQRTLTRRFERR